MLIFSQSLMVAKAKEELEQEMVEKEEQKEKYLEEKVPPIQISGMSAAELKVELYVNQQLFSATYMFCFVMCCDFLRHCVKSCMPSWTWWMKSDTISKPRSYTIPERYQNMQQTHVFSHLQTRFIQ